MAASAATIVALAVPAATALSHRATNGNPVGVAHHLEYPPPVRTPGVVGSQGAVSDEAAVYAAVLRDWQQTGIIRVDLRVCDSAGTCSAGPRTNALRDQLVRLLGTRIRFEREAIGTIALEKVEINGTRATARLQENCGRMCIHGEEVGLSRLDGTWRITGDGSEWIS